MSIGWDRLDASKYRDERETVAALLGREPLPPGVRRSRFYARPQLTLVVKSLSIAERGLTYGESPKSMRVITLVTCIAAIGLGAAAPLQSPEEAWKAAIANQNKDYAQVPHAMLKIQDSVYLGEGQSAVLQGFKGRAGSWRWNRNGKSQGALGVALRGGKLTVTQGRKKIGAGQISKSIIVDTGVDVAGQPTQVGAGVDGWRLFVYNQQNPVAKSFAGVSYFPYDSVYRVTARFIPDKQLPPRVFRTSRGTDKQFFHAGDASFILQGKSITLPFYTNGNSPRLIADMSAFFTDYLTGHGAYGAGRYVDVDGFGKFPPSTIIIDFNQAYNPNCARSAHFTCPVAIDTIPLPVKAGERDPHMVH